jgi:formamidopyrimidine-DNA glycosylase
MPELPEVETVRRTLELELSGPRITSVSGRSIALRRPLDVDRLKPLLIGRQFANPRRRGKFLIIDLEPPGSLLVHLGMTGRIQLVKASLPRRDHTHLVIHLNDGRQLRYVDPRRFGLVDWLEPGMEERDPSLARLGVEPLDPSLNRVLPAMFHSRRAPLKSLLLDQRLVAGIGNIYAAEALYRSGIHPRRSGNRTSLVRLAALADEVRSVLGEAIDRGGTTLRDFADPDGEMGYFAQELSVYGRQGEGCPKCGTTIRSDAIGGRTTAWCPQCQR